MTTSARTTNDALDGVSFVLGQWTRQRPLCSSSAHSPARTALSRSKSKDSIKFPWTTTTEYFRDRSGIINMCKHWWRQWTRSKTASGGVINNCQYTSGYLPMTSSRLMLSYKNAAVTDKLFYLILKQKHQSNQSSQACDRRLHDVGQISSRWIRYYCFLMRQQTLVIILLSRPVLFS